MIDELSYNTKSQQASLEMSHCSSTLSVYSNHVLVGKFRIEEVWDMLRDHLAVIDAENVEFEIQHRNRSLIRRKREAIAALHIGYNQAKEETI